MRIPKRLYDMKNLTSYERVQLLIKAIGRRDTAEEERLLNSTPHKSYRGRDWNVVSLLIQAERIATAFTVMALEHFRYMGGCYLDGFRLGKDCHDEAQEELLNLKSLKKTFDVWCEEHGIDPLDMVSFHPCGRREYLYIERYPVSDEDVPLNEEYYDALQDAWRIG